MMVQVFSRNSLSWSNNFQAPNWMPTQSLSWPISAEESLVTTQQDFPAVFTQALRGLSQKDQTTGCNYNTVHRRIIQYFQLFISFPPPLRASRNQKLLQINFDSVITFQSLKLKPGGSSWKQPHPTTTNYQDSNCPIATKLAVIYSPAHSPQLEGETVPVRGRGGRGHRGFYLPACSTVPQPLRKRVPRQTNVNFLATSWPEDGNKSSFRNAELIRNMRRCIQSTISAIQSLMPPSTELHSTNTEVQYNTKSKYMFSYGFW
jgi:hypothetical protein